MLWAESFCYLDAGGRSPRWSVPRGETLASHLTFINFARTTKLFSWGKSWFCCFFLVFFCEAFFCNLFEYLCSSLPLGRLIKNTEATPTALNWKTDWNLHLLLSSLYWKSHVWKCLLELSSFLQKPCSVRFMYPKLQALNLLLRFLDILEPSCTLSFQNLWLLLKPFYWNLEPLLEPCYWNLHPFPVSPERFLPFIARLSSPFNDLAFRAEATNGLSTKTCHSCCNLLNDIAPLSLPCCCSFSYKTLSPLRLKILDLSENSAEAPVSFVHGGIDSEKESLTWFWWLRLAEFRRLGHFGKDFLSTKNNFCHKQKAFWRLLFVVSAQFEQFFSWSLMMWMISGVHVPKLRRSEHLPQAQNEWSAPENSASNPRTTRQAARTRCQTGLQRHNPHVF